MASLTVDQRPLKAMTRNFSITGLREGENDLYLKSGFGALFGNVKAIA
jgi:hypothetical protein